MKENVIIIAPSYIPSDIRVIEEGKILNKYYNVKLVGIGEKSEKGEISGIEYIIIKKGKNIFSLLKNIITNDIWEQSKKVIVGDLYLMPIIPFLKAKGYKIIGDAHEYASGVWDVYNNPFKRFVWRVLEYTTLKLCDGMITVSKGISDYYSHIIRKRVPVFYNLSPFEGDKIKRNDDKIIFVYAGGVVKGRGLDKLVRAFCNVKNKKILLKIVGGGSYLEELKKVACNSIEFTGFVKHDEMYKHILDADIGIVSLEGDVPNHWYSMPNKLFWYLSAGLPVIVPNYKEMSSFVSKSDIGWLYENERDLENILHIVINNKNVYMRKRENAIANKSRYIWKVQEKKFVDYVRSIWEK